MSASSGPKYPISTLSEFKVVWRAVQVPLKYTLLREVCVIQRNNKHAQVDRSVWECVGVQIGVVVQIDGERVLTSAMRH